MNEKDLEGIRANLAMARHFANSDIAVHAVERAEAAFAAEESELRECDVGTPVEQAERFRRFCGAFTRCRDCPCGGVDANVPCALAWAHRLYEPVGVHGPIGPTGAQGEPPPPAGLEDAATFSNPVQVPVDTPRIEDLVTTVAGVDWGHSDASASASAAPTVAERFELPF